ncbi:transcription repressor OFP15 [Pistacia vera]|uniref:transcription repressor OFP15 n=1 Tax=Pistacia vera TaxID=55513 RepID=UPI0012632794|nr:transcription repressor OFP15 [Pistacia vera]
MGKKMKLPNFLSKNNNNTILAVARSSSWPWPSCHQPRTLSFRTNNNIIIDNNTDTTKMFKTINSAYNLDLLDHHHQTTPESSWFTTTSDSAAASFSAASEQESRAVDSSVENVIKGLKSETERLFFEPGETSSILEEAKTAGFPFKKSLVLSMESQNPYIDFRKSMEEMVEAHGLKDWEDLEELLSWYLRVNGKSNHGYIVGAFVDLLVALAFASSSSSSTTTTSSSSKINTATSICSSSSLASACSCSRSPFSPLSFYTSSSEDSSSTPCTVSLLEADEEEEEEEIHTNNSSTNPCLSSLLEAEDEIEQKDDASTSS